MPALNGANKNNVTDMCPGKYRLFELAKDYFSDPYNGDCFAFLSKNHRTLKMIRYNKDEIKKRLNRTHVTEILGGLLSRANRMLKDIRIHFGDMMDTALNYMIYGWKELLNYRYDDRYDIDNTKAGRKIRPLTIGRKNTLFYGGKEGVRVATTYYTLIETCKLNGLVPLDYLMHVFRQLMMGNNDYKSLLPGELALQTI